MSPSPGNPAHQVAHTTDEVFGVLGWILWPLLVMSLAFAILMLVRAHRIWRAQGQLMGYHPHPNDRTEQAVRNRAAGQSPPRWYTRLHCRVLGHRAVADPAYVLPGSSAAVQRHQGFHVICGRCGTRLADSEDDLAVPDPSWFRTSDD